MRKTILNVEHKLLVGNKYINDIHVYCGRKTTIHLYFRTFVCVAPRKLNFLAKITRTVVFVWGAWKNRHKKVNDKILFFIHGDKDYTAKIASGF